MSQKYAIGTQFRWKPRLIRSILPPKCVGYIGGGSYRPLWQYDDGSTTENTWTESDIDCELISDYTPLERFVRNKLETLGIKI